MRATHRARASRQFATLNRSIRIGAAAIIIAVSLRIFVLEPFNIPSESMLPTLQAGDYLFVAKWPYGLSRYSLPLAPPLFHGRLYAAAPRRGDVVVFKTPRDNRTDFIKRVVGLPGDRVRMVGGAIELNGTLVSKTRAGDFVVAMPAGATCHGDTVAASAAGGSVCRYPRYIERLGDRRYAVLDQIANDARDNTPLVTVPAGHYFVEGDNRDDSADSRLSIADGGVGMVPAENLIGRAEVIFFSTGSIAPYSVRWGRIGTRL